MNLQFRNRQRERKRRRRRRGLTWSFSGDRGESDVWEYD